MLKLFSQIVVVTLACLLLPVGAIYAQNGVDTVEELWLDVSMRPQIVDIYNRKARPNDIARIDHISMIDVLGDIKVGRTLVIFKSIADTEQLMPRIGDQIDIIGYNLEHGPSNQPAEQADPIGSIIEMRRIADQYGKTLALGPDHDFAISHGAAMAPYVDMFILQVQRVQANPATVQEFVIPLVRQFRAMNPDIEISIQIRTEGNAPQLRALVTSLLDHLDGVSILTSPETVAFAQDLLYELRPENPVASPSTDTSTATDGETAQESADPAIERSPNTAGTNRSPGPSSDSPPTGGPIAAPSSGQDAAIVGAIATVGIIGLALTVATVLFIIQSLQSR